jgi:serine protease inhibitor
MKRFFALIAMVVLTTSLTPGMLEAQDQSQSNLIVHDHNQLAMDLYRRFAVANESFIFSPASIYTALSLLYGGARGETASQISSVLGASSADEQFHDSLVGLQTELAARATGGQVELSIANALWPQDEYPILDEYGALAKRYGATIAPVDYQTNAEGARQVINAWAAEKTNNLITNLLEDPPYPTTLLILANAIYFKGDWEAQFNPDDTTTQPFYGDGGTTEVQFMNQEQYFNYRQYELLQLLEMPYLGETLSMLVLLPTEGHDLAELEAVMSADSLGEWTEELWEYIVTVSLPRFSLHSEFDLKNHLQAMGVTNLFAPRRADLSGIDGVPNWLSLGFALQKAFIDVNEEGAEAAAVTVGGGCFPAGAPVLTSAGSSPIQEITEGTLVRAYDWETLQWVLSPVVSRQSIAYRGDVISIRAGGAVIDATANHPFYVLRGSSLDTRPQPADVPPAERRTGREGRWVSARDLRVGDLLMTSSGHPAMVSRLSDRQESIEVYNLTVESHHNYTVGGFGALVHNKGAAEPPTAVFRADHPFIYLIRDNSTGAILFMGKVGSLAE